MLTSQTRCMLSLIPLSPTRPSIMGLRNSIWFLSPRQCSPRAPCRRCPLQLRGSACRGNKNHDRRDGKCEGRSAAGNAWPAAREVVAARLMPAMLAVGALKALSFAPARLRLPATADRRGDVDATALSLSSNAAYRDPECDTNSGRADRRRHPHHGRVALAGALSRRAMMGASATNRTPRSLGFRNHTPPGPRCYTGGCLPRSR